MQLVYPVQAALDNAESLHGTLECLSQAAGYVRGIINLVKDFADVRHHTPSYNTS
jgi:phosphomevalonate kinase